MSQVTLPGLAHATGSINKYRYPLGGFVFTDGVKYVMENGASWLVTDIFAQLAANPLLKGKDFLVINFVPLKRREDKPWLDAHAYVEYKTDDGKVVVKQEYVATDLVVEVQFFYFDEEVQKILILRSEY